MSSVALRNQYREIVRNLAPGVGGAALYDTATNVYKKIKQYADKEYVGRRLALPSGSKIPEKRKRKVPQKKSKMANYRGSNAVNAQATRVSMKKGKMSALKSIKKRKTVKVPKKLRTQIKQVLSNNRAVGTMKTLRTSTIGTFSSLGTQFLQSAYLGPGLTGVQAFRANCITSGGASTNNYSYWGCGVNFGTGSAVADYDLGAAFVYFSPGKVLDAASIMWNEKAASTSSWTSVPGNLTTRLNTVTGVVDDGKTKNLKIEVKQAYAKFTLKNNSQRALKVLCYYHTSKKMWADKTPLQEYLNAVFEADVNNGILYSNNGSSGLTNPLCKPQMFHTFNANWKTSVTEMFIKPGEECVHTVQGPKNVVYDYAKYYVNADDKSMGYHKGTAWCTFAVLPDMQIGSAPAQVVNRSSRYIGNLVDTLYQPISVEVEEVYRLSCPEVAGFIHNDGVAGSSQLLNSKVDRIALFNYSSADPIEAGMLYAAPDEENPAVRIQNP